MTDLQAIIENAWDTRDGINTETKGEIRDAVQTALNNLDQGKSRIAEKKSDGWYVHQWLKKAVLLSFRLNPMERISGGPQDSNWWDKVPSKFNGWKDSDFQAAGFRAVPNAIVRHSAYIAPNVVLMPSFVNLGAYVDEGTMVDTWATIGSCAQIGKHCHISGGTGIGGILEPLQAGPVIIEDNVFIGSDTQLIAPVTITEGTTIGAGSTITRDTPVGKLTLSRVEQVSINNWVRPKKIKK